ncbi:MAG: hypothetical protein OXI88_02780 [Gammaproteobacteria bacterium]|nr:hypothetical protein [Gammaproteobacteria bacterium]
MPGNGSVRASPNLDTAALRAATQAAVARRGTAPETSAAPSSFNAQTRNSLPLSLGEISAPAAAGAGVDALGIDGAERAAFARDLREVRTELAESAGEAAQTGNTATAARSGLTVLDEWMTRAANRSEAGTEASLVERQALGAQAGLTTLAELLREAQPGPGGGRPALDPAVTDKARQLLEAAAEARAEPQSGPRGEPAGEPGWLAAELERPVEFTRALANRDLKAGAGLQHEAMRAYLGDKEASGAQKRTAREVFLRQVDDYLAGTPGARPPQLTGADHSATGVLKPGQKVSLLLARSLERAGEPGVVPGADRSLLKEMTDPDRVGKRLEHNLKQALRAGFKPIETSFTHAGREYLSELKPDVSEQAGNNKGVLCYDTHSPSRVPNMWHSHYKDATGKTLFKGTRSGVLSAFGIRPPHLRRLPRQELHDLVKTTLPEQAERLGVERCARYLTSRFSIQGFRLRRAARFQANRNRVRDLVRFHLQNNARLMAEVAGSGAQSPRVKMVLPSINLVTPDYARSALAATSNCFENYNELRMTRNQNEALQEIAREDVPVTVKQEDGTEKTVRVQLVPLTFSAGVNDMALGKINRRLLGSWRVADKLNRPSIRMLLGENFKPGEPPASGLVAEHLQALENAGQGNSRDARAIRQLADQVGAIWQAKGHHAENDDPYALPARLALLASKMGMDPQYNCKSGKDRTGQLDAEIKFLATRIEQGDGAVPQPGAALNEDEKGLFSKVLLRSGNHEVQKMNTGSPGYKVKLDSITRRMDSMMSRLQHLGSGKFVSA